jgi:hypothetical protein
VEKVQLLLHSKFRPPKTPPDGEYRIIMYDVAVVDEHENDNNGLHNKKRYKIRIIIILFLSHT